MRNFAKTTAKRALLFVTFAASAASAEMWVGSYKVHDGPRWGSAPTVHTGFEAAALVFGGVPSD